MSRLGVNEIIPNRLWQRGQFLGWTYAQKEALLDELGVDVVVNLWHRVDPDLSARHPEQIYINWFCSPSKLPSDADRMVRLVTALLGSGRRVLVHCEAGRGRSVWFSTRVYAAWQGIPLIDAWYTVKAKIPRQDVKGPLLADLLLEEEDAA